MSRSCEQRHVFQPENGAGPQTLLNIMKLNKFAAFAALGFFALIPFHSGCGERLDQLARSAPERRDG